MNTGNRIGLALGIPVGVLFTIYVIVPLLDKVPPQNRFTYTNVIIVVLLSCAAYLFSTIKNRK